MMFYLWLVEHCHEIEQLGKGVEPFRTAWERRLNDMRVCEMRRMMARFLLEDDRSPSDLSGVARRAKPERRHE